MGLDIHHLQATLSREGRHFCRVEAFLTQMQPLERYFQQAENEHVDWEKMFATRGLVYENYRLKSRGTDGTYTAYAFADAGIGGAADPVKVIFSNEPRLSFLPKFMLRSKFEPAGTSASTLRFFGPFPTVTKSDAVVFFDRAGHQQNGVAEEFYREFRPDDLTCSRERVERIYELTLPEFRDEFKRTFLDNWEEGRSFVLISW